MRRADIERLLPGVYRLALDPPDAWDLQPDPVLAAILDTMEQMHHPIEEVLDSIETVVDPRRTRPALVPYLCGWLDLAWLLPSESTAMGHLREVVAAGAELSRWRGTRRGLLQFLATATGISGFAIDEGRDASGAIVPFHITVRVPPAAASRLPLIERIVLEEKPAYVTHELDVADAWTGAST